MACSTLSCTGWKKTAGSNHGGRRAKAGASENIIRLRNMGSGRWMSSGSIGAPFIRSWRDCGESNMFDLEQAIAQWRRQLAAGALTAPEVLDELESHLRDDIEAEVQSGSDIGAAFAGAVQRIGPAGFLQCEFDKIGPTKKTGERVKHAIFTFAGIPNQYSSTLMNTSNSVIEPSWATYLKAAVFLVPVLSLWAFSTVFLLPKVQTICRDAGIALPVFFRIIFAVISTLREQGIIIVSTIV